MSNNVNNIITTEDATPASTTTISNSSSNINEDSSDKTDAEWMVQRQKELYAHPRDFEVNTNGSVKSMCYTLDGKYIVAGGGQKIMTIDASNGKIMHEVECNIFKIKIVIAPNNQWMAVGGRDDNRKGFLKTFNITINDDGLSLSHMYDDVEFDSRVNTISIHPNSDKMAVGCADGTLQLYNNTSDTLTPASTNEIVGKRDKSVYATCFSPDGEHLVTGGWDCKFVVYDSTTMDVLHQQTFDDLILSMAFSPDGTSLVVAGWMKNITTFKTTLMYAKMNEVKANGVIDSITYSPNGRCIVAGGWDNNVMIFDSYTLLPQQKLHFSDEVRSTAFSPNNGNQLVVAGEDEKVSVFDVSNLNSNFKEILKVEKGDHINDIMYSPDASSIVMARNEGKVSILNLMDKNLKHHTIAGDKEVNGVAFSPDGKEIAVADAGGSMRIYDFETMKMKDQLPLPYSRGSWVGAVAYSPDSKHLAVGGEDKKLVIYNRSDWEVIHTFERDKWVYRVAYSPQGQFLAFGGYDNNVTVHDCSNNMKEIYSTNFNSNVLALSFSADGKLLAVGEESGKISILDGDTGFKQNFVNPILFDIVNGLSFSHSKMSNEDTVDYHTLGILSGEEKIFEAKIHKYAITPPELLLKNEKKNDDEIVQYIKDHNISVCERTEDGMTALSLAVKEDRTHLVQQLLQNDYLAALTPNFGDAHTVFQQKTIEHSNGVLQYLFEHHLPEEIKKVAEQKISTQTPDAFVKDLAEILDKYTDEDNVDGVITILNAGQDQSSMMGYVEISEVYRNTPIQTLLDRLPEVIRTNLIGSNIFSQFAKKDSLESTFSRPLSTRLPPRTSSIFNDISVWNDIEKDDDRRVKCKVIRVLLPGLTSLETLKKLTKLSTNKAFNNKALGDSIDAAWFKTFQHIFFMHALLYLLLIVVPFTCFCENVRFQEADYNWKVYLPVPFILCGLVFFAMMEVRSMCRLGMEYYWKDPWNITQWTTKIFILVTCSLALSEKVDSEVIAILSSITIMMSFIGLFFYLRGIEGTAWIVIALYQITVKAYPFLLVMLLVILTFAMGFHFLDNRKSSFVADEDMPEFFDSIGDSVQTTVFTMTGDYSYYHLKTSFCEFLKKLQSNALLILTSIIFLNALIAFIGDTFDKVLGEKAAVLKKQRAKMIIEMYSFLPEKRQKEIEEENLWVTSIVPAAEGLSLEEENEIENFRKANKEDVETLRKEMKKDFQGVKEEMEKKMDGIKEEMKMDREEMKKEMVGIKEQMEKKMDNIKEEIDEMKKDMNSIKDDVTKVSDNMEKILALLK